MMHRKNCTATRILDPIVLFFLALPLRCIMMRFFFPPPFRFSVLDLLVSAVQLLVADDITTSVCLVETAHVGLVPRTFSFFPSLHHRTSENPSIEPRGEFIETGTEETKAGREAGRATERTYERE